MTRAGFTNWLVRWANGIVLAFSVYAGQSRYHSRHGVSLSLFWALLFLTGETSLLKFAICSKTKELTKNGQVAVRTAKPSLEFTDQRWILKINGKQL